MATSTFQADDGNEYRVSSDALGRGGQGTVHVGRRHTDGGAVAIKRIVDGAAREPDANRELQIALKLGQQPPQHLLAPLTWAIDGDDLLLVMPLADRSLADELAEHPDGLSEPVQLAVLRDITAGLAELRVAGIVHRDLKPGNVLLYSGRWHLADFGMSRDLDVRTATVTFQYGGTLPYLAPERWRGQPATHKSDLYALGCIAHELATGNWLFPGRDAVEQQHQHLHTPPPATPVSPTLARWILRLLDKDPARRPQGAESALADLPSAPAPAGPLAAAALQLAQRRQQQAAGQGQVASAAEARAAERRQALADLADICAAVADRTGADLPDLRWDDHGDVQRFQVDDIRLDLVLWMQVVMRSDEGLVLAGEVSAVVNGRRRCMANLVCEMDGGRQQWYLDTFTCHPFTRRDDRRPAGFLADDFFEHYGNVRRDGEHAWQRQHELLSPDVIVGILTELLLEAVQS